MRVVWVMWAYGLVQRISFSTTAFSSTYLLSSNPDRSEKLLKM